MACFVGRHWYYSNPRMAEDVSLIKTIERAHQVNIMANWKRSNSNLAMLNSFVLNDMICPFTPFNRTNWISFSQTNFWKYWIPFLIVYWYLAYCVISILDLIHTIYVHNMLNAECHHKQDTHSLHAHSWTIFLHFRF